MKKRIFLMAAGLLLNIGHSAVLADERYDIRADGLACPYCAYGIEKKFMQIEGVKTFDIDLEKGLVIVTVEDGVTLTEPALSKLFKEAGFSYRGFTKVQR